MDVGLPATCFTHDTQAYDSLTSYTATERGPPVAGIGASVSAVQPSIDSRSRCSLAPSPAAAAFVVYHYDYRAKPSQGATDSASTAAPQSGSARDLSSLQHSGVAANAAPKALNASTRVAPWAGASLSRLSREGEVMYRVYGGGAGKAGSWLTPINPVSSAAARQGLALPAENAALYVSRVTLPGGVRMQVGSAGSAFGRPGGWAQAQLLERIPLSSFGKGVPLQ
ncbi:MAG: hypothetical protein H0X12_10645 [Nocardioides sp.]|nr:hypothetical protein [Nocardioides sp.]